MRNIALNREFSMNVNSHTLHYHGPYIVSFAEKNSGHLYYYPHSPYAWRASKESPIQTSESCWTVKQINLHPTPLLSLSLLKTNWETFHLFYLLHTLTVSQLKQEMNKCWEEWAAELFFCFIVEQVPITESSIIS